MAPFLLIWISLGTVATGTVVTQPVVRLTVQPRRAPVPVLKYQLLPEVREMNPGNAAQWYVRCFAEQNNFFFNPNVLRERAHYRTMPLAELAAKKLRYYGGPFNQADWAARLDTIDWQVLPSVQNQGFDLTLTELTPLQELAAALHVRFRVEVAARQYDDAVRSAKTMFGMARHLGEHPTKVAGMIGLSVAELSLGTLEEMAGQPDSPNLYWALSDLPSPLIDLRRGAQGNRAQVDAELRRLKDSEPMTDAELEHVIGRLSAAMSFAREQAGQAPRIWRSRLRTLVADEARVQIVLRRLVKARLASGSAGQTGAVQLVERVLELGRAVAQFSQMPALQLILLDEKRDFEVQRDEALKLLQMAPWQANALGAKTASRGAKCLFAELLPDTAKSRLALASLNRRIGLLRHVEALRLHAADHGGKLPAKLEEIAVPLPVDPFTGKPFSYKLVGDTAHLGDSTPGGGEAGLIRYEVSIAK